MVVHKWCLVASTAVGLVGLSSSFSPPVPSVRSGSEQSTWRLGGRRLSGRFATAGAPPEGQQPGGGGGGLAQTDLPASFDAAVDAAAQSTLDCLSDTWDRIRVDFDTSGGDATYTVLKNTMPLAQGFLAKVAPRLVDAENPGAVRVYFPDAGSAALAQRDWKIGSAEAVVPECVQLSSLSRELPEERDQAIVFMCPRASEVDALRAVVSAVEDKGIPLIFLNPELVDMGVTGFGAVGRMLRETLINTMVTSFCLKTTPWGAIARAYPKDFSTYVVDPDEDSGYKLMQTSQQPLDAEELDALLQGSSEGSSSDSSNGGGLFNSVGKFFQGLSRL